MVEVGVHFLPGRVGRCGWGGVEVGVDEPIIMLDSTQVDFAQNVIKAVD